ncbi:polymorphic toxin-type HINT domain-containing protein, partial [Kribbella sp. DT2]|uniref:polymorphic toxin-type HINT domain-containing protein n=1 Tax=Kribbella sp. DT2 TaxID=3393427 RepID=UPI003CE8041E
KSRGFVDGQLDPSTRLTHLGDREYDPDLGRFISVDPLVDRTNPQQLNAYAYATNSPVSMSDPDGLAVLVDLPDGTSIPSPGGDNPQRYHEVEAEVAKDRATPQSEKIERQVEQYVSWHKENRAAAVKKVKRIIKDLVKIVADEFGVTDALNCFTEGDISSCVSTGVTVLSSFVGGILGKLATKYGAPWKWKKAAALIGRIAKLAEEAIDGIKDWRRSTKALESCPINSFLPGTRVLMADGSSSPIEDLQLGDRVLATDPATGKTSAQPVVRTIIGEGSKSLVEITTIARKGRSTEESTIVATQGHPFYLPTEDDWADAGELRVGDRLDSTPTSNASIAVAKLRGYTTPARVHNLTVANLHTYYVLAGRTAVLVHNSGCFGDKWTGAANVNEHFDDHGAEMGFETLAEYKYAAEDLMCTCDGRRPGVLLKRDGASGRDRFFDPQSGEFGSASSDGIITFFKPDDGLDYFKRQPGVDIP